MARWLTPLVLMLVCLGWFSGYDGAMAQAVVRFGMSCPEPSVQPNFDLERYMGRWFEYEKFPNFFEMGAKCVIANYTLRGDNSVRVLNMAIQEYSYGTGLCPWYQSTVADGNATVVNSSEPAKLGVRFNENAPPGNYWVLETDYDTYSIVYGCTKMPCIPVYTETAWVLTREREVPPANLNQIKDRLTQKGLDVSYFEISDHDGCPDWPRS